MMVNKQNPAEATTAAQTRVWPLIWLWILIVVVVGAAPGRSHDHTKNIRFERISLEEGLSQAFVACTLQDRDGFMWFGTQEGLNRFDGYTFTIFAHDPENPKSLSHNFVKTIFEDSQGTLWIGTDGGGLNRFDPVNQEFTIFRNDPDDPSSLSHDRVRAIVEDSEGHLWIATDGGGLNLLDREGQSFSHFLHDSKNPESLSNDHIRALVVDHDGHLWIGSDGGGISRFDPAIEHFTHFRHSDVNPGSLAADEIRSLLVDREGLLWVGMADGGLDRFEPSTGEFTHFPYDPSNPRGLASKTVWAIHQDRQGSIWVGTDNGLNELHIDSGTFSRYVNDPADPYSLSHNRVASIFEDRGGVLWVGTYTGLNKWNRISEAFTHFRHRQDLDSQLSADFVTALQEGEDGTVWIGTYGGGLNRFDRARGSFQHLRHDPEDSMSLSDDRVMSLHLDANGVLWIGTFGSGLDRFDPATGEFRNYRHDPSDPSSLSFNGVTTILRDSSGVLWVGTYRGGLNRLRSDGSGFDHFRYDPEDPDGLSNERILAVYEDSFGTLWIGTDGGGLNRFVPATNTFESIEPDRQDLNSLSSAHPWFVTEDDSGDLWIGTQGGGVSRWAAKDRLANNPRFTRYTRRQGLLSDVIYAVLVDLDGSVWMSSDRGLTQLDPRTDELSHFDASHGLQSNEFNHASALRTRDGQLFFGGISGFNAFYPRAVHPNENVPAIVLTRFLKFNQEVVLDRPAWKIDSLSLTHEDSVVDFEFAALDFSAPSKNRYMYQLEGFDRTWVDHGTRRRVTYTNLGSGEYTFRVRASNNDGVWSEEGLALALSVAPPPWKSWWAYSLYALAICCALLAFWRVQIIRRRRADELARANIELTQEIAERQRKEKELEAAKRKAQTYFDVAEVLMVVIDPTGTVSLINQKGAGTLGYTEEEIVGQNWYELVVPHELHREVEAYLTTVDSDEYYEYPVFTSSADQRIIAWHTTYLTDDNGNFTGVLSSGTDVTQVRRLREAKEVAESANRAKSQFLANMSHEIRTPMNGVLGMVELLLTSDLSEPQRKHAATAMRSAKSLLDVLNDILDFSKIEAGKLEIEEIDFDLHEMVNNSCQLFGERAHAKGLELGWSVPASVPAQLRGDPTRLNQILANLIGNAVKFTEQGRVEVAVVSGETQAGQQLVRFTVNDTGVGLDAEARDRIFESFHQADGSTTRKFGGTGLGLAISKELVELMRGRIGVESEAGKGSTFWFEIPFEQCDRQGEVFTNSSSPRILVVDDNRRNRVRTTELLERWGYAAESAEDGWEALATLRQGHASKDSYSLAVIDLQMPDLDGLQLAQIMRTEPALQDLPILLMLKAPVPKAALLERYPNVVECLAKPWGGDQLRDALAKIPVLGKGFEQVAAGSQKEGDFHPHGRILMAEDSPLNQEVVLGILETLDTTATIVENGREAVRLLSRETFDLVLMDCQMPLMDGYEATQLIRQQERFASSSVEKTDGHVRHVPIVAMTASAMAGDRERCLSTGMDDYLSKPFTRDQLVAILEKWMDRPVSERHEHRLQADTPVEPVATVPVCDRGSAAESPINDDALEAIRALEENGSPGLLDRLIETYLNSSPPLIDTIRRGVEDLDAEGIERAAHSLKSSSATLGATALAELSKELESMGRQQSIDHASEVFKELESEFNRVRRALSEQWQETA